MFVTFLETSWNNFKKRTKIKCPIFIFRMKNFYKKTYFSILKHYAVNTVNIYYNTMHEKKYINQTKVFKGFFIIFLYDKYDN